MKLLYRCCAGLDVHKDTVMATVLVWGEEGVREVRKKEFGTHWKQLQRLARWLRACRVERVAMESTGVYWKPAIACSLRKSGLACHNRIHKVLEDANIKPDTVLSDLLGVSGRATLQAMVKGHCDPGWLARLFRDCQRRLSALRSRSILKELGLTNCQLV